jgi:hypothetical protein
MSLLACAFAKSSQGNCEIIARQITHHGGTVTDPRPLLGVGGAVDGSNRACEQQHKRQQPRRGRHFWFL